MRVLVLPRYARMGASSRLRMYQFLPFMNSKNIQTHVAPLFSDKYIQSIQDSRRSLIQVFISYLKRVKLLICTDKYDVIWIEKELFPWLPYWVEAIFLRYLGLYVLDYDDAVFHSYDSHPYRLVRRLLGAKHKKLIKGAAAVVVGNDYLALYAIESGANKVEIIPTSVDLDRYKMSSQCREENIDSIVTIGWIGQRSSAHFLEAVFPLLKKLIGDNRIAFSAIGVPDEAFNLPMQSIKWTEETEVNSIFKFDVGIMPLLDEPFERGKCGYKLIQYMACGIPVVASPVGANNQIVKHGVNGFLAKSIEEWEYAINILIKNPELRKKMGFAGRDMVEEKYSIEITAPKLVILFQHIALSTLTKAPG